MRYRRLCDFCAHALTDHATGGLACLAVVNDPDQSALVRCQCQAYNERPPRNEPRVESAMSIARRFWRKVERGEGCWNWQAARFRRETGQLGYGMFSWRRHLVAAHRVSWSLTNGPIPTGMLVLHHCDNPQCVRPDHLYLGTHADNMRDAVVRCRMRSGAMVSRAKLTESDIPRIKQLHATGMATEKIGPLFGVSGRTIRYVVRGEHWKYV